MSFRVENDIWCMFCIVYAYAFESAGADDSAVFVWSLSELRNAGKVWFNAYKSGRIKYFLFSVHLLQTAKHIVNIVCVVTYFNVTNSEQTGR